MCEIHYQTIKSDTTDYPTVKLMDPIVVTIEKTAEQKDITERVRALANYNREKFIDSLK